MKNEHVKRIVKLLEEDLAEDKKKFEEKNISTISAYYNGRIQATEYALRLINLYSEEK